MRRVLISGIACIIVGVVSVSIAYAAHNEKEFEPPFNATLSEMNIKNSEQVLYVYTAGYNEIPSRTTLLQLDGTKIKEGDISTYATVRSGLFLYTDSQNIHIPSQLEQYVHGELTSIHLPPEFFGPIIHLTVSPDERFLFVQGNTPDKWYVYNRTTAEWNHDFVMSIPEELKEVDPSTQFTTRPALFEWKEDNPHTLFIKFGSYNTDGSIGKDIAAYQLDAEEKTLKVYDLSQSYGPLQVNPSLPGASVPIIHSDYCNQQYERGSFFSVEYTNPFDCDGVPPESTITIRYSVFGKQKILLSDGKQEKELLSWNSVFRKQEASIQFIKNSSIVLVNMDHTLGILDTTTGQYAKIADLAYMPQDPDFSVVSYGVLSE